MSHYHLELVMPPTEDVKAAVTQILAPFCEHLDRDEEGANGHPFFDYWVIGGRWSGEKMVAMFSKERTEAFHAAMRDAKVTVSSFRCGKEELKPADQIEKVDAMWREHFPESPLAVCPLFDNYKGDMGDVMNLEQVPDRLTAARVIVAAPGYDGVSLEAAYMVEAEFWNGVCHNRTAWSGKFHDALAMQQEHHKNSHPDYLAKTTPKPDWLVVTIDYHT
jgi:hypothetical protein